MEDMRKPNLDSPLILPDLRFKLRHFRLKIGLGEVFAADARNRIENCQKVERLLRSGADLGNNGSRNNHFGDAQNLTRRRPGLDLIDARIDLPLILRRIKVRERVWAKLEIDTAGFSAFEFDLLEGFQLVSWA